MWASTSESGPTPTTISGMSIRCDSGGARAPKVCSPCRTGGSWTGTGRGRHGRRGAPDVAGAYAKSDWRVVDYELYSIDPPIIDPVTRTPLELRGPRPPALNKGGYFVCIGGAQTF